LDCEELRVRFGDVKSTIIVFGHGPGISDAVARRFGREGFRVALVARNQARLEAAAEALVSEGITAKAFCCDAGDPDAVRATVRAARQALGPIGVVHWNAYSTQAGDLTVSADGELRGVFDVAVTGLVAATQEALADLENARGSVLITGGGFSLYDAQVDKTIVDLGVMGLGLAKAAQHKLAGLLHHKLASRGVYVGEVVVLAIVKGTSFDQQGHGTLEADEIATKFWEMHQRRTAATVNLPSR
jgi:NAD(P)-dependent dehydrogenase (short-subunit alcohol dehydrogenase family)